MKELVIISGKGGTGKTSLTAAFARWAGHSVLADCDVDAADLHLLLHPELQERRDFRGGHKASIRAAACTRCGQCQATCRFAAIAPDRNGKFQIDPNACEGCGVCRRHCPADAIDWTEPVCGELYISRTACGPLVHARLMPGAENSGKLVTEVRKTARELAEREHCEQLITDGPPGIGCPVIAAVSGADAVLIVTEPTVSGKHDLDRVLQLTRHFQVPALVCVNKWDLNPETTERIEAAARTAGATVAGRIPYDLQFTVALVRGQSIVDYPESAAAKAGKELWEQIWHKK